MDFGEDDIIYTNNGQKRLDEIQLGDELLIKTSCDLYNDKDLLTEDDLNNDYNSTLEEKVFQSTKLLQIAFLKKYLSKYGYFDDSNLYRINDINNLQYLLLHFNILSDKLNNLLTVSDKTSYYALQQFLNNEKDLTMIKAIAPNMQRENTAYVKVINILHDRNIIYQLHFDSQNYIANGFVHGN